MPAATVTERSFYEAMTNTIRAAGGTGVQEVRYNSVPDIVFTLGQRSWLLSVKIGEDNRTLKDAFLQYLRHKRESAIDYGLLVLLPESVRRTPASEDAIRLAVRTCRVTALIDAGDLKQELRDRPFPEVVSFLAVSVIESLGRREARYYSLSLVISLLQEQVAQMMAELNLGEDRILRLITSRRLFMDLGHLRPAQADAVGRFLASYIVLSQILFLRLLHAARPGFFPPLPSPVSAQALRSAFNRVLEINYRPIYEIDVLDSIPSDYVRDTFDLIWGLEVERVRHDLPGRIFHELMPKHIRKMLAAFYTRPLASDLLARLCLDRSDATVFDPACGSGTILVSAYRRKLDLFHEERLAGNPHSRFCQEEIFGADIMPFAVHLTSANLSAADAGTVIDRTQVMQCDSLKLGPGEVVKGGVSVQLRMFHHQMKGRKSSGEEYDVALDKVDAVLMNPPFTKVERGIGSLVNMDRFAPRCGGEVGLWGHFVALAEDFVSAGGLLGAVLPINVLRGRESERVRAALLSRWTPLYILKPTRNYGFSEWAEYRDVLLIAKRGKPEANHRVKFALVKKDLTKLTDTDVRSIAGSVKTRSRMRSRDLDIDSRTMKDLSRRFANLMWYCGVTDLSHRDAILRFLAPFIKRLQRFPDGYFHEGYRPVPAGVSRFLFLTRNQGTTRTNQAFLSFTADRGRTIEARSPLGATYQVPVTHLRPTLRTPVGLATMDITGLHDYIAFREYGDFDGVVAATGFDRGSLDWATFWSALPGHLDATKTRLVVCHRINPFSPALHLAAFYSDDALYPSNQMNVILEDNPQRGKAVCALLNSAIFLAHFILLKEESTGRYINIRFYDLEAMTLFPPPRTVPGLANVFDRFAAREFPPLRHQLDGNFDDRYRELRSLEHRGQPSLLSLQNAPVNPAKVRLDFDMAVARALGVPLRKKDLLTLYGILVDEMMLTQGLARD